MPLALAIILLGIPAHPRSAPSSQVSANDLARRVITNELTFQDDHTNWMYRLEKEQSGKKRLGVLAARQAAMRIESSGVDVKGILFVFMAGV